MLPTFFECWALLQSQPGSTTILKMMWLVFHERLNVQICLFPANGKEQAMQHTCIAAASTETAPKSPQSQLPVDPIPGVEVAPIDFEVSLERASDELLGISVEAASSESLVALRVASISERGVVGQRNRTEATQQLREGDVILEINGVKEDVEAMRNELQD
eukprot:s3038_g17.t1